MKLYVVVADDHDHDAMSQWVVGVYQTYEDAEEAGIRDCEKYKKILDENGLGKIRWTHNYEITEVTVGEDVIR